MLTWHSIAVSSILPCDNLKLFERQSDSNLTLLVRSPIESRCVTNETGPKVYHPRSQHQFSTPVVMGLKSKLCKVEFLDRGFLTAALNRDFRCFSNLCFRELVIQPSQATPTNDNKHITRRVLSIKHHNIYYNNSLPA